MTKNFREIHKLVGLKLVPIRMSELRKGDIFTIKESDGCVIGNFWLAVENPKEVDGVFGILTEPAPEQEIYN